MMSRREQRRTDSLCSWRTQVRTLSVVGEDDISSPERLVLSKVFPVHEGDGEVKRDAHTLAGAAPG